MTWPTNWIEQAVYYQSLVDRLAQLQVQGSTVIVHSFTEPLQQDWEDAYTAQTGLVPPALPGTRLIWYDLKNGQPKHYETVWASDAVSIDPLVRPYLPKSQPRSCLRFLGTRQMMAASLFNPANSPIRHRAFSLTYDIGMLVRKNLISLIVHYRMYSPVQINLFGEHSAPVDYGTNWGYGDFSFGYYLERAGATTTSTQTFAGSTGGATPGYMPLASSYGNVSTIVTTEQNFGYSMIFAPAAATVGGTQQPLYPDIRFIGFAGALTAQATPLHVWQGMGAKLNEQYQANLKNLYVGTTANRGEFNEHAYLYGIFASDPGPLEVFDV